MLVLKEKKMKRKTMNRKIIRKRSRKQRGGTNILSVRNLFKLMHDSEMAIATIAMRMITLVKDFCSLKAILFAIKCSIFIQTL